MRLNYSPARSLVYRAWRIKKRSFSRIRFAEFNLISPLLFFCFCRPDVCLHTCRCSLHRNTYFLLREQIHAGSFLPPPAWCRDCCKIDKNNSGKFFVFALLFFFCVFIPAEVESESKRIGSAPKNNKALFRQNFYSSRLGPNVLIYIRSRNSI